MSAPRRRNIADTMDELDRQIWDLQQSKKETYESYRAELKSRGLSAGDIKAEVEALKKGIVLRRKMLENPVALDEMEARVDEILADIMPKAKAGTQVATHARRARAETPHDTETGEVLGDATAPEPVLYHDGSVFAPAAEMLPSEQEKAEAAARGFPAPDAQPAQIIQAVRPAPYRIEPRVPAPAPEWPEMPTCLDRTGEGRAEQEAAE